MTPAYRLAVSVLAGLDVLDHHAPAEAERLRNSWHLSEPLARLIKLGHVDRITADGKADLMALDRDITAAIDQVERGLAQ